MEYKFINEHGKEFEITKEEKILLEDRSKGIVCFNDECIDCPLKIIQRRYMIKSCDSVGIISRRDEWKITPNMMKIFE